MGSHGRHRSGNTLSAINDSFKWGDKLEGDFGSKLEGDSGLAVNLKVMVTISNGLSLNTLIHDLPSMTVSNGG